ncbi:GntR family transcriptional regulator [Neokomagataea thailandica]|uniref:GntR family transcriptional regulator n=1 Tax=Neokomagataea tanensis NBRC 106556 TaxID=1223519 RepID=A0ABQ0QI15_9PROT|nr:MULTISPECIES: GntR family transcriptional regulator [Neokomagataea]GBR45561.1 GntR family transcriptional regulator [Neokomagataea tanensis NBRC 106556]
MEMLLEMHESAGLIPEEAHMARCIREAIFERRMPPGTKLPEEHLAVLFETTRGRVRRVLLALSREHIVALRPGKGAMVARPGPEDAQHILEARRVLEVGLLEHPCRTLTVENYAHLKAIIDKEQQSHEKGDALELIRLSGQFHLDLTVLVGNQVIAEIQRELILRTSLIIALFERQKATCCLTVDHGMILDAVWQGRLHEASRLMGRHLLEIEHNLDFKMSPPPATSLTALLPR